MGMKQRKQDGYLKSGSWTESVVWHGNVLKVSKRESFLIECR